MSNRDVHERAIATGICPVDQIALDQHPRCFRCGLLIGSGHFAARGYPYRNRLLCRDCATRPITESTWDGRRAYTAPSGERLPPGVQCYAGRYRAFVQRGRSRIVIDTYADGATAGRAAAAGRDALALGGNDAEVVQAGRKGGR